MHLSSLWDLFPEHLERNCKRSEVLSARFVLGTAIELMNCCCPMMPLSQIAIFPKSESRSPATKTILFDDRKKQPLANPRGIQSMYDSKCTWVFAVHPFHPCFQPNHYTVLPQACCTSCTLAFPTTCHREEAHIRSQYCHVWEQTPRLHKSWGWFGFEQRQSDSAIIYNNISLCNTCKYNAKCTYRCVRMHM